MVVEPNSSFNKILQLQTCNASMDIDLIGLSKNNKGSAAVAFMSFTDMADILKPSFFNTAANTWKTLVSIVVLATLPKTTNKHLTTPVNVTFTHTDELDPEAKLSCVYWKESEWVEDGCAVTQTNSTHTVCSCDHLSVFALIMEIVPCKTLFGATVSLHCNRVLNMSIAQVVGIFFLTLCLLTFSFCCRNPNETNTALINLCLNLLLFHLVDLLKNLFQPHLQPPVSVVHSFSRSKSIPGYFLAIFFLSLSSKHVQS
ncbi:adhesion G protein-coupled receptor E3-like [Pangasianodon hypophthalmus]|uniref:adhesion G protein-coupled receptor E3-like n=1 Tax=Pangasianodon hypophthalmus TaxID=310915 RepID=UPI00230785D2|nr:adhesion G protein-coupled receptor E3-like [Pangasianodon hypophthalmus]